MANFRQIHPQLWGDEWVQELPIDGKLLYVYLVTGPYSEITGLYKITPKTMAFDTSIDQGRVEELLDDFTQAKKIVYTNGVIWVCNMLRYHITTSPKLLTGLRKSVQQIPDGPAKEAFIMRYGDTLSIPYPYSINTLPPREDKIREDKIREEGEDPAPTSGNPNLRIQSPDIAEYIYRQVTGSVSMPSRGRDGALEIIYDLQHAKGEGIIDYLKPFYEEYITTKGQNGQTYYKGGYGWLDWAAVGEIPTKQKIDAGGYTHG